MTALLAKGSWARDGNVDRASPVASFTGAELDARSRNGKLSVPEILSLPRHPGFEKFAEDFKRWIGLRVAALTS